MQLLRSKLTYASVEANGQVIATRSKGITSTNVTNVGPGEYCIGGLPFTVHVAVASAQLFLDGASTFVGSFGECPAGTQVVVETWRTDTSTNDPSPFMLLLN